jgi:hypothetical protein
VRDIVVLLSIVNVIDIVTIRDVVHDDWMLSLLS